MKLSGTGYVSQRASRGSLSERFQETLMRFEDMTIRLTPVYGLMLAFSLQTTPLLAQRPSAASPQAVRIVGTVTSVEGNTVTIQSDAGPATTVNATDSTRVLRAEPGAKSLA